MKQFPEPVFDDAQEARRRAQADRERAREEVRGQVRAHLPEVTRFADALREQFEDVRLVWAVEDRYAVGKVPEAVREEQQQKFGPLADIGR